MQVVMCNVEVAMKTREEVQNLKTKSILAESRFAS